MTSPTTDPTVREAARAVVNAGSALSDAIFAVLSPTDQTKWQELELAGADASVTVNWSDGAAQVFFEFLPSDSQPQTILALKFDRTTGAETH